MQLLEAFLAANTAATGDEHLRVGDIDFALVNLHILDHTDEELALVEFGFEGDDVTLAVGVAFHLLHHTRTHGGHLRTMFRTHDGSHQVAAESGTGHHQLTLFGNLQTGTVGGKTSGETGSQTGTEVTTDGGSANHQDAGFELVHHLRDGLCVLFCQIIFQFGFIDAYHFVSSIFDEHLSVFGDIVSGEDCHHLFVQNAS